MNQLLLDFNIHTSVCEIQTTINRIRNTINREGISQDHKDYAKVVITDCLWRIQQSPIKIGGTNE